MGSCVVGGIVLGILVLINWLDPTPAPAQIKTSGTGLSPYAEAKARERAEAMEYWWNPAEHFAVSDLRVLGSRDAGSGGLLRSITMA